MFDLDASRILANFDVVIPRKRWKKRPDPGRPAHAREADLEFSPDSLKEKSFSFPVTVSSDPERKHVVVAFAESTTEAKAVALSARWFAYVRDGELLGFYLDLIE